MSGYLPISVARPLRVELEDAIYGRDYAAVAQRIRRIRASHDTLAVRKLVGSMLNDLSRTAL